MPLHVACLQAEWNVIGKSARSQRLKKLCPMHNALARLHAYIRSIASQQGSLIPATLSGAGTASRKGDAPMPFSSVQGTFPSIHTACMNFIVHEELCK